MIEQAAINSTLIDLANACKEYVKMTNNDFNYSDINDIPDGKYKEMVRMIMRLDELWTDSPIT